MGTKKFFLKGIRMILVLFFFSHRALSIGIGREGIGLKMTEIAQTDTHSAFNVLGLIFLHLYIQMSFLFTLK
jgi:hypothetical protein